MFIVDGQVHLTRSSRHYHQEQLAQDTREDGNPTHGRRLPPNGLEINGHIVARDKYAAH